MMTQPMRIWMVMALLLIPTLAGCAGGASDPPDVSQAATPTTAETMPTEAATPTAAETTPTEAATPTAVESAPTTESDDLGADATPPAGEAGEDADEPDTPDLLGGGQTAGETVTNDAGYSFVVPEGWQVFANTLFENAGVVLLIPASADPEDPPEDTLIAVNMGPPEIVFEGTPLPDDPTVADLIDAFVADTEEDVTLSDVETVQIDGVEGRSVEVTGPLAGGDTEGQGRVVVALLDDGRALAIIAAATSADWDPAALDALLETMEFGEAPADSGEAESSATATPAEEAESAPATGSGELGELDADGQVTENTFPLPEDASNVQALFSGAGGSVNYETALSAEEVADFYREQLTPDGAVEREILTQITDGVLNLVFDGWAYADGRAVVIQTVPLGPDVTNVNVRFEDI